jgi:hypothetical protein
MEEKEEASKLFSDSDHSKVEDDGTEIKNNGTSR